jgi:MOSC domain-containing protein YiiM
MSGAFRLVSINVSASRGTAKTPVDRAVLKPEHGIDGDAHAGNWHRQVSLLADEDIETLRGRGVDLPPGIFAENLTTRGIDLAGLPVGARLRIGSAVLEVTQVGKECHQGCSIRQAVGDCVMPRRGVFARVLSGGEIDRESRCCRDL